MVVQHTRLITIQMKNQSSKLLQLVMIDLLYIDDTLVSADTIDEQIKYI